MCILQLKTKTFKVKPYKMMAAGAGVGGCDRRPRHSFSALEGHQSLLLSHCAWQKGELEDERWRERPDTDTEGQSHLQLLVTERNSMELGKRQRRRRYSNI